MTFYEDKPTFEVDGQKGKISENCTMLVINVKRRDEIMLDENELKDMLNFIRKMKKQKEKNGN